MSRIYSRVTRVAGWPGWCSPCQREDRPLVLTRSGPGGLRSWLSGASDDDRVLLLTCRVCGAWQVVPAREEDDPEVLLHEDHDLTIGSGSLAPVAVPLPRAAELPAPVEEVVPGELVAGLMAEISAVAADSAHTPPPPPLAAPVPATLPAPVPARLPMPRVAEAASVPQAAFSSALPRLLGLPVGTRQLVLALAS